MNETTDLTLETPPEVDGEPGAEPTPEPAPTPEPEPYAYRVRDEQYDLPRDHVDAIAERLGRRPHEIIRDLQISGDSARLYREHREREARIARREAEIDARNAQIEVTERRLAEAARMGDVEITDPSVRFLVDQIKDLRGEVHGILEGMTKKERDAEVGRQIEEGLEAAYGDLMDRLDPDLRIDPRTFFGTMDRLGIAKSEMDDDTICELTLRYIAFEQPRTNGTRRSAPATEPTPRRDPRRTLVVPASASGPSGPVADDTRPVPGETLEQKRERLQRALGNMKWPDLRAGE